MIQIPAHTQILVMHEPINFRNGIDGTAAIARVVLAKEPMQGAFFVFRNKMGHSLRVLYYDGGGYWICTRRLSKGTYNGVWPKGDGAAVCQPMLARELQVLIWGGNPADCAFPDLWRRIA
jgi:transposase